jgi:hypothetical protein
VEPDHFDFRAILLLDLARLLEVEVNLEKALADGEYSTSPLLICRKRRELSSDIVDLDEPRIAEETM